MAQLRYFGSRDCQRSCPVAGMSPPCPHKDLHKVGEVQRLEKNIMLGKDQIWLLVSPPRQHPSFLPPAVQCPSPPGQPSPGQAGSLALIPRLLGSVSRRCLDVVTALVELPLMGLPGCCIVFPFSLKSSL